MRIKAASAVLAGLLVVAGAGCGADDPPADPPVTEATPDGGEPTNGADAEPGAAPAAFNEDGASGSYACDEQNITINGEDTDLHLTGPCGMVVINGERAQVVVDDAQLIVINGEGSEVTYSGDPEIVINVEDASAEPA